MKRNHIIRGAILTCLASIAIVQACNNLDLQPLDKVTTTTFYKTPADFDGAIFPLILLFKIYGALVLKPSMSVVNFGESP
jgi:hypothetical protein